MNNYIITTDDTMTGTVVDVPVNEEVYTGFVRTAWTIKKNNQKHWQNEIPFSCLRGFENLDTFNEFADYKSDPAYVDPDEELYEALEIAIGLLDEDEQKLISALFYESMTLRQYAERKGMSKTAIAYRKKKALKKLKEILKKNEEIF